MTPKKLSHSQTGLFASTTYTERSRKWLALLSPLLLLTLALVIISTATIESSRQEERVWQWGYFGGNYPNRLLTHYVDSYLGKKRSFSNSSSSSSSSPPFFFSTSNGALLPAPSRLAYFISGSRGDGKKIKRLLQALYHPMNHYVVHLDMDTPFRERQELAKFVQFEKTLRKIRNVVVLPKGTRVNYKGPTMLSTTLQAAAVLLKQNAEYDWFINVSAEDYPLMTQDDILHVLSQLPRHLNFIEHTSDIGWKLYQRAEPVIFDPALWVRWRSDIFWGNPGRPVPESFRLFTGSAWLALTKSFMDYTIMGWDNMPRMLLMYYTNFVYSVEGYFHTVICNTPEFQNTTINHDLRYVAWDMPPKQDPMELGIEELDNMTSSGAAFGRRFKWDDSILDVIDRQVLGRGEGRLLPGAWCVGKTARGRDPCDVLGDPTVFKPGPGAKRFEMLINDLLSPSPMRENYCAVTTEE